MHIVEAFLLSFLFHILYLYSIFDIEFKSQLVNSAAIFSYNSTLNSIFNIFESENVPKSPNHGLYSLFSNKKEKSSTVDTTQNDIENILNLKNSSIFLSINDTQLFPPSKRVVLFVVEGLDANLFFENHHNFLNISKRKASWGISHSQIPTEMKPCHIGMIRGFYYDASAVKKSWSNSFPFDTIFHHAQYTSEICPPDIVNIIKNDNIFQFCELSSNNSLTKTNDFEMENNNLIKQEDFKSWKDKNFKVVQSLKIILNSESYKKNITQDQSILLLHFDFPWNNNENFSIQQQFKESLIVLDKFIDSSYEILETFFNDNKTSYIFSGAQNVNNNSNLGNNAQEIKRTPFIAWGAGIRTENDGDFNIIEDGSFIREKEEEYIKSKWDLNHLNRKDIHQIDIASLICSLIGIHYPINNLGILPLSYLDGSDLYRSMNLFANSVQILNQYIEKEKLVKSQNRINFIAFNELRNSKRIVYEIANLISNHQFRKADLRSVQLINLSLKGITYYQDYDRVFLNILRTIGYLSWIGLSLIYVLKHYSFYGKRFSKDTPQFLKRKGIEKGVSLKTIGLISICVQFIISIYFFLQGSPLIYHLYTLFPIIFIISIIIELPVAISFIYSVDAIGHLKFEGFFNVLTLEIIVFGYFMRELLSAVLLCFGMLPILSNLVPSVQPKLVWIFSCICLSLFTLLPFENPFNNEFDSYFIILGSLSIIFMECLWCFGFKNFEEHEHSAFQKFLFYFQLALVFFTAIFVSLSEWSRKSNYSISNIYIYISWCLLFLSPLIPLLSIDRFKTRLQSVILAFSIPYIILSEGYDVLFFSCFSLMIKLWASIEVNSRLKRDSSILVYQEDFSSVVFFIFLLHTGIFGTNTVSSIVNSGVYAFGRLGLSSSTAISIFIILKQLIIPHILTISLLVILQVTRTPKIGILILLLSLFDVLTLNFFFMIKNTGSLRDIKTSIIRFSIGNTFPILSMFFVSFSMIYTWSLSRMRFKRTIKND